MMMMTMKMMMTKTTTEIQNGNFTPEALRTKEIQGVQKVCVNLMITIQKDTSNVQSVPRQSPDIYWHVIIVDDWNCSKQCTFACFCTVIVSCTEAFCSSCRTLLNKMRSPTEQGIERSRLASHMASHPDSKKPATKGRNNDNKMNNNKRSKSRTPSFTNFWSLLSAWIYHIRVWQNNRIF